MNRHIFISINERSFSYDRTVISPIIICEVDEIQIRVMIGEMDELLEIYFEDYKTTLQTIVEEQVTYVVTPASRYFSECFGYAAIRIQLKESFEVINFDVRVKKTSAEQARKMITYLASHSEDIIKCCFSRSSLAVGSTRADGVDSETLLSAAEALIETFQSFKLELLTNIRVKLLPVRVPLWDNNIVNREIDPNDVIHNLDCLTPSSSYGDAFLRGRNFDLHGIDISGVQPSSNVIENRILLGGLYSVRRRVTELRESLEAFDANDQDVILGYESFARLMLSLTAGSMLERASVIIDFTNDIIRILELKLKVKFAGEIIPMMTPYARSTRVYKMLFTHLNMWYDLGALSLVGVRFLMKLKSLSKIYELFTFFHIIEHLYAKGWAITQALAHHDLGEHVPSSVSFKKINSEATIELQYEPQVNIWNEKTEHMGLVDVGHHASANNPYWKPDFVLRLSAWGAIRYLILDAKYSTRGSVKEYHIPELFEKYFVKMAVYDEHNKFVTHEPIVGVFAIYSVDDRPGRYISKWQRHGINNAAPRIPMIGGIGLMTDNSKFFDESLSTILEFAERTISRKIQ